jgi:membrane associated rhomboid family serine protease
MIPPLSDDAPRFSTPFVTYFIIALNTLIFLFELSVRAQGQGALNSLIDIFGVVPIHFERALTGASSPSLVALFLPILTAMFLHVSWPHVIANMWALWIFGDNVEDYLGHLSYLLFYLSCGVMATATHILLNAGSKVPSVGASGAIAGVMGAYFVLYPRARVLVWFVLIFRLPAWLFLGFWFVLQFMSGTATSIAETSQSAGIAFWAHVGGFVAGVVLIKVLPERPRRYRYAA